MFTILGRTLIAVIVSAMLCGLAKAQSADSNGSDVLGREQLAALVAPIALYPDPLLAAVLMAATYPIEVVQAARWLEENEKLKPEQLAAALDKQDWDKSVKSLVATPSVLQMMSAKLDWTESLGDAVLAQQADVMNAVQDLRARAQASDKLVSTGEQKVSSVSQGARQLISIEPANPETIHVPYYDPDVVYGDWPYDSNPPYAFAAPPYVSGGLIAAGIAFGTGYALGRWTSGGNYWGGGINWSRNDINVNRPVVNPLAGGNSWRHDPSHRKGVRYSNTGVEQKFGGERRSGSAQNANRTPRAKQAQTAGTVGRGQAGQDRRKDAAGKQAARPKSSTGASPKAKSAAHHKKTPAHSAQATHRPANRNAAAHRSRSVQTHARPAAGHANFNRAGGGSRVASTRGGGRRSDIRLKEGIVLLGYLESGIGLYRFKYKSDPTEYVGVLAQDVVAKRPEAVVRGEDGFLRVRYEDIGVRLQTYQEWLGAGAKTTKTHLFAGQMPGRNEALTGPQ